MNDVRSSSIIIVVSGGGKIGSIDAREGVVIFSEAKCQEIELTNLSSDFLAFRAYTPVPKSIE